MPEPRKKRSPILDGSYRRGKPNPNKGLRMEPEILTREEINELLESFGGSAVGIRNRAAAWLMYRNIMPGELVKLAVTDYTRDPPQLRLPGHWHKPKRVQALDSRAVEYLDAWLAVRKKRGIRRLAPLFCNVIENPGSRLDPGDFRVAFNTKRKSLGWEKRIHPNGLLASGRLHATPSVERQLFEDLEGSGFKTRYPGASASLKVAQDLYEVDPKGHATPIGHACREALRVFAREVAAVRGVEAVANMRDTVDQLRAINREKGPRSHGVRALLDAVIKYWGAVSDLANRQDKGAEKEGERLEAEDARRIIFHTLIVMYEVDRAIGGAPLAA